MGTLRAVGHLDADCFYVSAERVRDPFLAGKPVGVLGNNGACVIAKSYEMKAKGVRTGEPIWDALKLCPDGIYVKRDFEWYEVLSRQMLDVTRELSPAVEYYSIDEFFFVAEADSPAEMTRASLQIRDRIFEATGLPVTVGVARTRTLAKLMSDQFKPFGAGAILTRAAEEDFLGKHEVTAICGIAARRAARVAAYGVHTCLDLCRMRRSLVRELLTVTGENIWRELNGESVVPLQTERPPHQTLSRGGSVGWATDDPHRVFAWTVRNLERLIEELHFHKVRPGRLTIWLRHADGPDTLGEIDLESPSDRFDRLLDAARAGLRRAWRSCRVSHMHLVASKLRGQGPVQRSLFEPPTGPDVVGAAKRAVNAKLGRFMVRSGATLPLKELYSDPSWGYDICDVRGKICF